MVEKMDEVTAGASQGTREPKGVRKKLAVQGCVKWNDRSVQSDVLLQNRGVDPGSSDQVPER
jgi:hypothetical protein